MVASGPVGGSPVGPALVPKLSTESGPVGSGEWLQAAETPAKNENKFQ